MLSDFIKSDAFTSIILAIIVWYILFVMAPKRSYAVGVELDDLPLSLKMKPFQLVRMAMLVALALGAWSLPAHYVITPAAPNQLVGEATDGRLNGPLLAFALHFILMFAFPFMTARERAKRDEPPGEWLTPALVFYRWAWLGLLLLVSLNLYPDILEAIFGYPLNLAWGIGLPLLAAMVYLLYWGLPGMATARRAADGDPQAIDALSHVRWLGLPAWLALLRRDRRVASGTQRGSERKLCPSCMRPIDAIDLYENLKFDACPHCNELVPPVFTLEDYIRGMADRLIEINSSQSEKSKARNQRVGKQENDLVQRMLRASLTLALRNRATDLHIIGEGGQCLFRNRVDGMLFTMLELPEGLQRLFISALKVMCNMDIGERRKPQDGSLKTVIDDVKLDIRVNTSPTSGGESASLRLLYQNTVMGKLDTLGMSPRALKSIAEVIVQPHGMVLVTGPTGSGKSTTLYNALASINNGRRNIITLEDPIEYKLDGITQMQIDPRKQFDFASGLRTILRQDPDVIMVGEIRDEETAKMAVDAAMTGHLVFSTLHTIDTTTTIGRLQDLEVDPHRHADALVLLISQRLVRINCSYCSEPVMISAKELEALGLGGGPELLEARRGQGCAHCNDTGYYGRNGIYELLRPDDKLKELIGSKTPPAQIRAEARRHGMRTLLEDGLIKVALGRTTIEEVLRVTN
jgi:general secretion pathway protein E